MTDIDWSKIVEDAGAATDSKFKTKIASLTSLTNREIDDLLSVSGINKENLASVLKEVQDATKSNEAKANAIQSIHNGVNVLVGLAEKLL